jgi:ribosomal protein S6
MEEKDIKKYELSFLVKEEGDEKKVLEFISKEGGTIDLEPQPTKISMAYPINGFNQAYFGYVHFSVMPEVIANLEHELVTKDFVLRHLIITPPFVKEAKPKQADKITAEVKPEGKQESPKSEPLTNEELEKKIEEILA